MSAFRAWSDLGVALPDKVSAAAAALASADNAQPVDAWPADIDKLTAGDTEAAIQDYARSLAYNSQFAAARAQIQRSLAGRLLRCLDAEIDGVLGQLEARYTAAAEAFTHGVAAIDPSITDAQELIDRGGIAGVKGSIEAAESQQVLESCRIFLRTLRGLPSGDGLQVLPDWMALADPGDDWRAMVAIDNAPPSVPGLDPALVACARAGLRFRMARPSEATATRERLEQLWQDERAKHNAVRWA